MLRSRDAPGLLGRFFLWKNDKGDDIILNVRIKNTVFIRAANGSN